MPDDTDRYVSLLADAKLLSVLSIMFAGTVGLQAVPPAIPSIAGGLVVADERVGLVVTAFFIPAAVALPVVGAVADMYGRRTVVLASLLLYGLSGVATVAIDTFEALLVLRALQGLAFPGLVPLSITLAGDMYTGARGSMAQGLRISVNGLAAVIVPAAAGVLAGVAWFYPFLLFLVAFPAFAFVYVFLPETKTDRGTDGAVAVGDYVRAVAGELRSRTTLVLVVGAFVSFFAHYGVVTYVALYAVRELGASTAVGGLLLSALGVGRIVVPLLSGPAVRTTSRKRVLLGTLVVAAALLLAFPVFDAVPALAVVVAGYGATIALFFPVLNDTVAANSSTARRASVVNTMEFGKIVAIGASPAAYGFVIGAVGFDGVFVGSGVLLVGYALGAAVLLRRRPALAPDAAAG